MSSKVLVIPCGGKGVQNYRVWAPLGQLIGDEFEVLDLHDLMEGAHWETKARWKNDADKAGTTPSAMALSCWLKANPGPWDWVYTNDHREEAIIFVQHLRETQGTKIVADCDDLFTDIPAGNLARMHWNMRRKRVHRELLEEADFTVVSTPRLAQEFGGTVCPNYMDPSKWNNPRGPDRSKGGVYEYDVVIYCPAGTGRAEDYLNKEVAFRRVLDELPYVKILCMGWTPAWAQDYFGRVVFGEWVDFKFYPILTQWIAPDIVVSPMEHNEFNKAKSNLKWLEAGMMNACFMGERWGEYERTVEDGVTGVLADSEDEWLYKLKAICADQVSRQAIAANGREAVLKDWTWNAVEPMWRKGVLGDEPDSNRWAGSGSRRDQPAIAAG